MVIVVRSSVIRAGEINAFGERDTLRSPEKWKLNAIYLPSRSIPHLLSFFLDTWFP